jgi:tetratricopeptide (TPR) repeat protein
MWFLVRGALAQRKEEDRALGLAVIAAFGVLALFWFPLRTALVGWPFVVAGAWLLRSAPPFGSRSLATPEPSRAQAKAPGARGARGWWRIVAATFLGVTTLLGSHVGVERLRANRILRDTEDRASAMAASGRIEPGILASSVSRLQGARRGARDDERIPLAIGSHHLLLGDLESAEAWYQESLALAPRAETFLNLGRLHWLRGDVEQARNLFTKAVVLNPALGPEVSAHLGH